jgi:hypothetical protein
MSAVPTTTNEAEGLAELRDKLAGLETQLGKHRRRSRLRTVLSIGGVVAALAAAGTVAYASIPAADGTVTACVMSTTGTVRIIDTDANQTCLTTEKKVQWSAGMRARGTYSKTTTDYKQGDVVYIPQTYRDTSQLCAYSSSTDWSLVPAGSWVRTTAPQIIYVPADGRGYETTPCLGSSDWSLLAKDGATGPTGPAGPTGPQGPQGLTGASNAHWAIISPTGTVTASSEGASTVAYYWSTGETFVWLGRDTTKCEVNVTAEDPTQNGVSPVFASFSRYYGYVLVETKTPAGAWINAATDISVYC